MANITDSNTGSLYSQSFIGNSGFGSLNLDIKGQSMDLSTAANITDIDRLKLASGSTLQISNQQDVLDFSGDGTLFISGSGSTVDLDNFIALGGATIYGYGPSLIPSRVYDYGAARVYVGTGVAVI